MHNPIQYKNKILFMHQALQNPNYKNRAVITDHNWKYVGMYLKRNANKDALLYWEQAEYFYKATKLLPLESAPLTAYYCFMNAVKALLESKSVSYSEFHGVSGDLRSQSKVALQNEEMIVKGAGILPALSKYLEEPSIFGRYSMKDTLYNLPFVHRAYCHTYTSDPELFIPIQNPVFVKQQKCDESWLQFEIEDFLSNGHTLNKLPKEFELDPTIKETTVIRRKKRFGWSRRKEKISYSNLERYHRKVRKDLHYITSINGPCWYIKRNPTSNTNILNFSSLSLSFMTMHRLSELARYKPIVLRAHLNSQHNWLLSEFILRAPIQFIDEISTEITGDVFKVTNMK